MEQEEKIKVPKGWAGKAQKELQVIAPHLFNECKKSHYCGFEIKYLSKKYFFGKDKGYRIHDNYIFPLTTPSRIAIGRGICDTRNDAKYFVDQLLYMDEGFIYMCEELKRKKEWADKEKELADKKVFVSLMIKNI